MEELGLYENIMADYGHLRLFITQREDHLLVRIFENRATNATPQWVRVFCDDLCFKLQEAQALAICKAQELGAHALAPVWHLDDGSADD